jgi:UDP-2,3-diacylglucosamine pyrophosphatase LpxH
MNGVERHEAIWLSDTHLGSRDCRADLLLDFLRRNESKVLYLVGDIVDIKRMRRSVYWPPEHTEVLRTLLDKSRSGTRVVYIPGNHDDDFRALSGLGFGNIEIVEQIVHRTAHGERLLVLHGDAFDAVIKSGRLTAIVGTLAYGVLLSLNRCAHRLNQVLGRPYWSLAQHVKLRIGNAVRYVDRFQQACLAAAAEAGVDGIVCGHIHIADIVARDGLVYYNDGDWVESCTALIENAHGRVSICRWADSATRTIAVAEAVRDAA